MLKPAIPNIFVKDFPAALAYYTGPLGFRPLFVYGDVPFYAHIARDEAILALRHITKPVMTTQPARIYSAPSSKSPTSTPCTISYRPPALTSASHRATNPGPCAASS
jgi:hypothetical protein